MKWQASRDRNGKQACSGGQPSGAGRDCTAEVIAFLDGIHGRIRRNLAGDYYYGDVSTISLHFLLGSELPSREVLWAWYRYFDRECGESIYQTLRPLQDERFLDVLERCDFAWDRETVRDSGLLFLAPHREQVYAHIEAFITARLDAYTGMPDTDLRAVLSAGSTRTEAHVRRLLRHIQTRPLTPEQREEVYACFGSDYLRATARHLMDEAASEAFWKRPPPELEGMQVRFTRFIQAMVQHARRLGVYTAQDSFDWNARYRARPGARNGRSRARANGNGNGATAAGNGRHEIESVHYAILGLQPSATLPEVKSAYRDKVKQYHPDQGGTVQQFLQVQEAYEYLLSEVY